MRDLDQILLGILALILMAVFYGLLGIAELWLLKKFIAWFKARRAEGRDRSEMELKIRQAELILEAERLKRDTSVTVRRVDY